MSVQKDMQFNMYNEGYIWGSKLILFFFKYMISEFLVSTLCERVPKQLE